MGSLHPWESPTQSVLRSDCHTTVNGVCVVRKDEGTSWWVANFIPKKTKKFKFEKNFMAMLFAIKNNP